MLPPLLDKEHPGRQDASNIAKRGTGYVASIWNASSNRVDVNNAKARRRYDEVVKARLLRGIETREMRVDGHVRGRE
eukprot:scaffold249336_cov57-Cyclotella_meneghiniana.AAC.3